MKMSTQNFNKAIQPLLVICKIFGMVPFQFSNGNYRISWMGIAYNVALIIGYLCGFSYMIYKDLTNPSTNLLLHTITTLQNLSGLGVIIVVWISSLVNQKQYMTALNKMNEIDKLFRNLGVWAYYEKIRRTTIKLIIGKCIFILISYVLELNMRKPKITLKDIILPIMHSIPLLVYTILSLQVYMYLKMVREKYIILNQHLKELQKNEKMAIATLGDKNVKLTSPLGTKLSVLRIICPLHHELCKVANMFNDIYGTSLLITFGQSFVSITTNMYYIITRLKQFDENSFYEILGILGAFLVNIIESIWVCWICHRTIEEVVVLK